MNWGGPRPHSTSSQIAISTGGRSQLPQCRGRTMQRLKYAGRFLVGSKSLEANRAPLNDKTGNFAGVGETGWA